MSKARGGKEGEHLAIHRHVRISPRKCRLVIDIIRGRKLDDAINLVKADPHRGAYFVGKLLRSAAAGAMEKQWSGALTVSTARVDVGPTIKRFMPRARGSAYSIMKRTCHIVIGLKPAGKDS